MSMHNRTNRLFRLVRRLDALGGEFFAAAAVAAGDPGLSPARGELLEQLQAGGGRLQVQDLAERTGRTKSSAAELAAKLCREDYAYKTNVAGDGRGVWVALSAKGRRAVALYSRIMASLDRSLWGIATDKELAHLEKLIQQIDKAITRKERS